jgi:type II secretory pathway pseudopilin PulG
MSLFNPWVLLGIIMSVMSAFGSGYWKGSNDEVTRQQLEIAALNAEARQKEQVLVSAIQTQTAKLQKANQDAKLAQQKRNADIDNGTLKLRLAVKASECSISTATDAESSSRHDTGTAEIQPETSRAILAIGDEADTTVRKLNACLAIYNQVREMINEKK